MAILNFDNSNLKKEIDRLKNELKDVRSMYDLLLESSPSCFFIFDDNQVLEFSPLAEEQFVFPSDFSTKTVEELFPIFQMDGESSKVVWKKNLLKAENNRSTPFEFEFNNKNGKPFSTLVTINRIRDQRFMTHIELVEDYQSELPNSSAIADNAPVYIKMTDAENRVIFFNKGWFKLLGKTGDDVYQNWIDQIHEDEKSKYLSSIDFAKKNQKKYEYSYRICNAKEEYRWLMETGTPRFSNNNKFIGYISAAIDITDRKNLEIEITRDEAIISAEKKIQESLDTSEVVALSTDTEGNIRFCNKKLLETLELKSVEIVGSNLFDKFIPESSLKMNQQKYTQLAVLGQYSGALSGKLFSKNNTEIDVRFNLIFLKDALNEVSGINLIGENVTARQIVKKQLERTNVQLKELFDNSYDLITIFDQDGTFQFVNKVWTEKLGYANKIETLKFKDVVNTSEWPKSVANLDKIIKGENVERFETVLISEQGKKIFVSGRVNCSFDLNGRAQFRGIFYDITERIRAEKAQSLYYKIASYNIEGLPLDDLYANLFEQLNNLLNIKNISIELNTNTSVKSEPFFRSVFTEDSSIHDQQYVEEVLSNFLQKQSKATLLYQEDIRTKVKMTNLDFNGELPKVWLGVPIIIGNENVGRLSIHSYFDRSDYTHKDLELLFFVSTQISLAIERKINEEKITDQAARLKAIFESSSHQIWSVDKEYKLTSFNHNYEWMLKKHFIKNAELGHDFESERNKINQGEDWFEKYQTAFKGSNVNFQSKLKTEEGKTIWTEVFINPIQREDQTINEVSVISNDITEKKNSELALYESESKFREIFESIQDIYFRCDMKGKITMISPSVTSLSIKPEDILGQSITDFFTSELHLEKVIAELLEHTTMQNLEARISDGRENKDFICNIRLLYRNENPIGIEGVARDISELKKTNLELIKAKDYAEKSLAIKERFLANMSHEIRTPMNGIIGMIDLIGSTNLDGEQLDYIQTIQKSSETLMVILNDILDLSKIEAGKMELKQQPIKLGATMEKLYDLFSQQAYKNNTSLYYHVSSKIPETVLIDETRLLQVLSNLTSNAIKFSDGKGTIHISLNLKENKNGICKFKVQVKDDGIGIKNEEIKNLFINFNQLDNSSTKSYGGTGLGLAISKEIVHSMNGDIGVVSTPGLGSTFWFTFEANVIKLDKTESVERDESMKISKEFITDAPVILVVDDNKVNRTVAGQILEKSGCQVDLAENGLDAIQMVKRKKYDLIFMDIQMPHIDGIETTLRIKKLKLKHTPPIVAMTAYSMEDDDKKFIAAGLDDYVPKPIKAKTIIAKVKDHLVFEPLKVMPTLIEEKHSELIINQNTLTQLSKYGGWELVDNVLNDFQIEAEEILQNCMKFYEEDELEGIRKELHTLKGSAGTLGVEILAKKVSELERQLKLADSTNLKLKLESINESYIEFQENYKNILQT